MNQLNLELIHNASSILNSKIRTTPIEHSRILSDLLGEAAFLKLENLQITGSFKLRGALFRLSQLSSQERARGIITCSAGNHGKAVAYVSHQLGIQATIYVPKNVDQSKLEGIQSYGAKVIRSPHFGYDDTETLAKTVSKETAKTFISPFDDPSIMAGNGGTLALEIISQVPDVQTVVIPVGGGGLAAGACFTIKEHNRDVRIVGCQHKESPALHLSLAAGKAVTQLPAIETVAGGIEGGLGENCFKIIESRIDECCLVSEVEIVEGFRWCLKHHQYLIEPSAAVVIAAALNGKLKVNKGPVVFVLSGRNVSFQTIGQLVCP